MSGRSLRAKRSTSARRWSGRTRSIRTSDVEDTAEVSGDLVVDGQARIDAHLSEGTSHGVYQRERRACRLDLVDELHHRVGIPVFVDALGVTPPSATHLLAPPWV